MPPTPAVAVEGASALRRRLKKASLTFDLKAAHRDIAALVVAEAIRRAPVRTGALRDSLRPVGTQASAIVRAGGRSVPYGPPIHWGWPKRNIRSNPFVLEAQEAVEGDITARYLRAVEQALSAIS